MVSLVTLYRDVNLLLDMIDAKIKEMKVLYIDKITSLNEVNEVMNENVRSEEAKAATVPAPKEPKLIVKYVTVNSNNVVSFR